MTEDSETHEPRIARIRENLVDTLGPFDIMATVIARSQHGPDSSCLFGVAQSPVTSYPRPTRNNPCPIPDFASNAPTTAQMLQRMQNLVDAPLSAIETNLPFKKVQERKMVPSSATAAAAGSKGATPVSGETPTTSSSADGGTSVDRRTGGGSSNATLKMNGTRVTAVNGNSSSSNGTSRQQRDDEELRRRRKRKRSVDRSEDVTDKDYENNREWQKPCTSGAAGAGGGQTARETDEDGRMTINDLFGDEKKRSNLVDKNIVNNSNSNGVVNNNNNNSNKKDCASSDEIRKDERKNSSRWKKEEGESPDSGFVDETGDSDREHPQHNVLESIIEDFGRVSPILSPPRQPSSRLPPLTHQDGYPSLKCVIDISSLHSADRRRLQAKLSSLEHATILPPKPVLSPPRRPTSALKLAQNSSSSPPHSDGRSSVSPKRPLSRTGGDSLPSHLPQTTASSSAANPLVSDNRSQSPLLTSKRATALKETASEASKLGSSSTKHQRTNTPSPSFGAAARREALLKKEPSSRVASPVPVLLKENLDESSTSTKPSAADSSTVSSCSSSSISSKKDMSSSKEKDNNVVMHNNIKKSSSPSSKEKVKLKDKEKDSSRHQRNNNSVISTSSSALSSPTTKQFDENSNNNNSINCDRVKEKQPKINREKQKNKEKLSSSSSSLLKNSISSSAAGASAGSGEKSKDKEKVKSKSRKRDASSTKDDASTDGTPSQKRSLSKEKQQKKDLIVNNNNSINGNNKKIRDRSQTASTERSTEVKEKAERAEKLASKSNEDEGELRSTNWKESKKLTEMASSEKQRNESNKANNVIAKDRKEQPLSVTSTPTTSSSKCTAENADSSKRSERRIEQQQPFTCCAESVHKQKVELEKNEDGSYKTSNFYQNEMARPLKHKADGESEDQVSKVLLYIESVVYFIYAVAVQLPNRPDGRQQQRYSYGMLRDTAELLKNTTSSFTVPRCNKKHGPLAAHFVSRVKVLSSRAQAVCNYQLYKYRQRDALKNYGALTKMDRENMEKEKMAKRGGAGASELVAGMAAGSQSARSAATPSPASSTHSANVEKAKEITVPMVYFHTQKEQLTILNHLMWCDQLWNDCQRSMSDLDKQLVDKLDEICGQLNRDSDLFRLCEYMATGVAWLRAEYEQEKEHENQQKLGR